MSETPLSPDTRQKIRELMGRATLARVRGDHQQALQLAQEALTLHERNYEVHEFIGDMLMHLRRGADALNSFKRARELNPSRVELEDKVARAAIQRAAVMDNMAHLQAVLEGRAPQEPKRSAAIAAIASLLLPGLGQLYNGEFGKGLGLVAAFLAFALPGIFMVLRQVAISPAAARDYLSLLRGSVLWLVPLALIYLYAIADAVVRAGRTASSDKPGIL